MIIGKVKKKTQKIYQIYPYNQNLGFFTNPLQKRDCQNNQVK